MPRLNFAMVCASNQNRSMEAHALLKQHGLNVESYGVGSQVKLPGPSQKEPNVYPFGTPYEHIHNELKQKNESLYTRNGLLKMLKRNMAVKLAPERWQDGSLVFDVVLTFEERVMDQVVDDMNRRDQQHMRPVAIINIDVKDNHEEAANAAPQALKMCQMLEAAEEWEEDIDTIITQFEQDTGRRPLYTICFY